MDMKLNAPKLKLVIINVIRRYLPIFFKRPWNQERFLKTGKRQTSGPFSNSSKMNVGNYRLVSLLSVPGRIMEQLLMEKTSIHLNKCLEQEIKV